MLHPSPTACFPPPLIFPLPFTRCVVYALLRQTVVWTDINPEICRVRLANAQTGEVVPDSDFDSGSLTDFGVTFRFVCVVGEFLLGCACVRPRACHFIVSMTTIFGASLPPPFLRSGVTTFGVVCYDEAKAEKKGEM